MVCSECDMKLKYLEKQIFGNEMYKCEIVGKGKEKHFEVSDYRYFHRNVRHNIEYVCYNCGNVIATNERDAIKFLEHEETIKDETELR